MRANHRRREQVARRRIFTRVIILSLILISVGLIFISRSSDARFAPLRSAIEGTTGRVVAVVGAPFRGLKSTGGNLNNLFKAHKQNDALRTENVELTQYRFRARALQAKLDQLESSLNVQSGLDIPKGRIAVRIISETRGPFAYSVLINAGRKVGVKVGYPVMHKNGMLGHVIRVGETSSRVLLLQDLNSRVSVMSGKENARAILIGKNDEPPILAFFDDTAQWKDGEEVVTSGDDGILPQGLPIGRILRSDRNEIRVRLFSGGVRDWAWVYPFTAILKPEDDTDLKEGDDGEGGP